MTRKKVKLAYITDDATRKATFKKRKKGIIKKVNELTILCGIQACALIPSPFDSKTEVWPDPEGAKNVIERYQNTPMIDERKNVNQERFVMQWVAKTQDQLKKKRQENREKEMTLSMFQYMHGETLPQHFTVEELKCLDNVIDKNMKEIENKIAALT
ncbi:agamous-like MADS-box protein AGL80 [Abrus precatorius]|uniref:Agamous-like MADS-box protein AGL80 n=1 Tax=Abrus precatorius TaxID=3816 RepID=A0A8B8MJK3_ABRPR|nr:agamous-like MADS-box protein AGL80 [Abrus precatorius]